MTHALKLKEIDESGVSGINYNGKEYYFRKNMLGDVIAIYASDGALQCRYVYSAWGEHEIYDASGNQITSGDNIGIKNPIRYRGYYYDRDLYLYYLQSRYYEPILGRFLSPDTPQNLDPATIQGLNLYTYCLNNPISYVDPNGNVAILTAALIGLLIGAIVGTVIGAVVAGVISYNSGARGWELAGDILFGAFLGLVIGGIAGLLIGAGIGGMSAGAFLLGGGAAAVAGGGTVALETVVAGTGAMVLGGALVLEGGKAAIAGFNVLLKRIGKSNGYRIDSYYPDDHAPAHVHISGDDGTTRVDLNGNPIQRDRPMTVGERKAFWNLIDKIIEELKLYFPNGG